MEYTTRYNGLVNRKSFSMSGFLMILIALWICILPSDTHAYPTLQLDILGGTYDSETQTIMSPGDTFTLYALLEPNSKNLLTDTYYVSAALVPKTGPTGVDAGSFVFNGDTTAVTGDMVYGIPPLETIVTLQGWDKGDLPGHGIYETYFAEFGFQFNSDNRAQSYNTQDNTGVGPIMDTSGGMYFAAFTVDVSGLAAGYDIHFDLYNTKLKSGGDIDITQFAPFSHDAQSRTSVPEPATLILLGAGLAGLGLFSRVGPVKRAL